MTRAGLGSVLVLLAALAAGCGTPNGSQTLPAMGSEDELLSDGTPTEQASVTPQLARLQPGVRPTLSSDEAGLWMRMDMVEARLKQSGNLVRDATLNAYVKDVVCKVAGPYCGDIRTYVVRVPYFNANMAPNGVMQVWTGLLLRVRNEAQLATVLGHEIAHYVQRHSLQMFRDVRGKSTFLAFFSIVTAGLGAPGLAELAGLGLTASIYSFSRDKEREADMLGQDLMRQAGYDPREAPAVWTRLIKEKNAGEDESHQFFFSSHPPSEERVETLRKNAAKMKDANVQYVTGEDRFRRVMSAWRAKFLRDDLRLRRFAKSEVMIKTLIEDGENSGETHFFLGELYRSRNQKGDLDAALEAYRKAIALGGAPVQVHRSLGLVHAKRGAREEANRAFEQYLKLAPDAHDRKIVETMVKR